VAEYKVLWWIRAPQMPVSGSCTVGGSIEKTALPGMGFLLHIKTVEVTLSYSSVMFENNKGQTNDLPFAYFQH
jgi:hypothetical protein